MAPFRPGFVSPPSTHKPTLAIRLRIALQVAGMSQRHWSIAGQTPSQQETIAMQHFYVRNGRRIQIPPTIQLLDEISPDYRPRLAREGRERVAECYLIFTDRDATGPGALRLAQIIRDEVENRCRAAGAAARPKI